MAQQNYYKADLRELSFLLFEQFQLDELLGKAPYANWGKDEVVAVLEEAYGWAAEVPRPAQRRRRRGGLQARGRPGARRRPASRKRGRSCTRRAGARSRVDEKHGGQARPVHARDDGRGVHVRREHGVQHVPGAHARRGRGDRRVRHARAAGDATSPNMFNGKWGGTMCLTEPHAGSDVGCARRPRAKRADGTLQHPAARRSSSPAATTTWPTTSSTWCSRASTARRRAPRACRCSSSRSSASTRRHARTTSTTSRRRIEHKMGINGSATCALNFGENDDCIGELVGTVEQQGHGPDVPHDERRAHRRRHPGPRASRRAAYLNALDYAKDRKQGALDQAVEGRDRAARADHRAPRRAPHAARHEGARRGHPRARREADDAHRSRRRARRGKDDDKARRLPPGSGRPARAARQGVRLATRRSASARPRSRSTAAPATSRTSPVEQYCRDAKIFSIYEGTNHIQAMDLVGRKLVQRGGANLQAFRGDVAKFVAAHKEHATLGDAVADARRRRMEALTGDGDASSCSGSAAASSRWCRSSRTASSR